MARKRRRSQPIKQERTVNGTERKTDRNLGSRDGATDTSGFRDKNQSIHIKKTTTMQITYNSYAKYDMALYFTRTENPDEAAEHGR